ncbi:hypothetical protein BC831DRAFT_447151 [Entophlyctis helioformis]|nr:hypothetical protein BC831DRAFT_447151 [Entophlyctis helioformis]
MSTRESAAAAAESRRRKTAGKPAKTAASASASASASTSASASPAPGSKKTKPIAIAAAGKGLSDIRSIGDDLAALVAAHSLAAYTTPLVYPDADADADQHKAQHTAAALRPDLNKPLFGYEEMLLKLLIRLDGVDVQAMDILREARKAMIRNVQSELDKVDARKQGREVPVDTAALLAAQVAVRPDMSVDAVRSVVHSNGETATATEAVAGTKDKSKDKKSGKKAAGKTGGRKSGFNTIIKIVAAAVVVAAVGAGIYAAMDSSKTRY